MLSGPMFEPSHSDCFVASACFQCGARKVGAHYNIYSIKGGIDCLKGIFPDGEANELNFALFSTSGVHGTYATIEAIEESIKKYPNGTGEDEYPDDYHAPSLTVLIVHPRIVCLRYGVIDVTLEDIPYLKKLRASSHVAMTKVGINE